MSKPDPAQLAAVRLAIAAVLTAALVVRRPDGLDLSRAAAQDELVGQAFSLADKLISISPPQFED